jgi:hypothetical protein
MTVSRIGLTLLAGIYFGATFAGSAGTGLPDRMLPAPVRFFTEAACLFPRAAEMAIEYRADVWSCRDQKFVAFDPRLDFPIRADDKESRFQRVGHFYRTNAKVMTAFEDYLVARHNRRGNADDGVDGPIGGIRYQSLRIPFPAVGEPTARYEYHPLAPPPATATPRTFFETPKIRRAQRCEAGPR